MLYIVYIACCNAASVRLLYFYNISTSTAEPTILIPSALRSKNMNIKDKTLTLCAFVHLLAWTRLLCYNFYIIGFEHGIPVHGIVTVKLLKILTISEGHGVVTLNFMLPLGPLSYLIFVHVLLYKTVEEIRIVKQKLGHRLWLKIYNKK